MDSRYYSGYLLDDIQNWELSEPDKQLLDACILMVDNKYTIRETAKNSNYSRSTFHRLIHTRLRKLSYELYRCVFHIINSNLSKHRR